MPTLVTFFPALLKAQKPKKCINFDKFYKNLRGGSGPKHSAFCGAWFSINPYKSIFEHFCQFWGRKITNRRLFPSAQKSRFLSILAHHRQHLCQLIIYRDPIYLQYHLFQTSCFYLITTQFHFLNIFYLTIGNINLSYNNFNIKTKFNIIIFLKINLTL
jgi:hypothetical protein